MSEKIILCPNPYKDRELEVTRKVRDMLAVAGYETAVSPEFMDDDGAELPDDIDFCELEDISSGAALAVSLGGDGTIMHTVRRLMGSNIPVLGVNLGTVGFLAELERSELDKILLAAAGNYTPSPRMMLKIDLEREGETVYSTYALNDVYMHGIGQTINVTASGDGRRIIQFSGDGIVVASPTGSTAYSMAAGGPLVEPTAENIILTPICAHALAARSFVLAPDRVVSVRPNGLRGRAYISADGGNFEVKDGDVLYVRKAEHKTIIAHVGSKGFYDIVFEKLGGKK